MTQTDKQLWDRFCDAFVPSQSELKYRARLSHQLWPEADALRRRTADALLEDTFLFQLPWDMEQTVEPVRFENGIDWAYFPGEDEEFTFMLNRHRYWICLGQMYVATGEEKYAECFVRQLLDWIEKEPLREEAYTHTWRTIEAGLRADYWCRAMALVAHSPAVTGEVIHRFFKALKAHGQRLFKNPRVGFSLKSNWGILEYSGLYILGHLFENEQYLERARYFLKNGLNIQVQPDGMQWEASPMYHNEVLMCMMEVIRVSRIFGDYFLDSREMELIRRMAVVNMVLKAPNYRQPMVGDSDDTDTRDLITQTAFLFQDSTLKAGAYPSLDYESVWLYGVDAAARYEAIMAMPQKPGITHLEHSGQIILRSSWEQDAFWLYFVNGPLGGGHGHADKLHVSLWMDGEEILVDPGRYTYTDTQPRYELKNSISHNVPMVDGEEYAPAADSWSSTALPMSTNNRVYSDGPYTFIEGGHLGYAHKGIYVNRRVVVIDKNVVAICDDFCGSAPERVSQRFHFGSGIGLEAEGNVITGQGRECQFKMYSFAQAQPCAPKCEEGLYSAHYNQLSTIPVADVNASGVRSLVTILVKGEGSAFPVTVTNFSYGKTLTSGEGEGYIIHAGGRRYGLVFLHQDVGNAQDLNGFEGIYGLGRTMVCDLEKDPEYMTVLQW